MKFGPKWVHMARYELILRLDGALWLTIILKPLLTPQRGTESSKINKKVKHLLEFPREHASLSTLAKVQKATKVYL